MALIGAVTWGHIISRGVDPRIGLDSTRAALDGLQAPQGKTFRILSRV